MPIHKTTLAATLSVLCQACWNDDDNRIDYDAACMGADLEDVEDVFMWARTLGGIPDPTLPPGPDDSTLWRFPDGSIAALLSAPRTPDVGSGIVAVYHDRAVLDAALAHQESITAYNGPDYRRDFHPGIVPA